MLWWQVLDSFRRFIFVFFVSTHKISILKIRQVKGEEETGVTDVTKGSAKAIALYNSRGNTPPGLGNMAFLKQVGGYSFYPLLMPMSEAFSISFIL